MKNALLVFRQRPGPIAIHRMGPTAKGLENIPREGGAIIAANHLAVIDDALLPLTCPRMIHFSRAKRVISKARASKASSRSGGSLRLACSPWIVPVGRNRLAH